VVGGSFVCVARRRRWKHRNKVPADPVTECNRVDPDSTPGRPAEPCYARAMSSPDPVRPTMSPLVVVLMLTLLLGIQPITTDLYLPALPTLQRDLGASIGASQLTLSTLIICFGLAQLVCGPLADRFGRRPVLLVGMLIYTVASVFAALAPTIDALIAWRGLQGAGMAAAVTCGRSIVRDLYEPHEGARVLSKALSGLAVIAMLSPMAGGLLVQWLDWHAALHAVSLFGAATFAFVAWRYAETVPARNPQATRIGPLLRNWSAVLANPTFRAWTLLSGLAYGGLFFMLAGSSFVFIDLLGTSRVGYGFIMLTSSAAYLAGTVLCRRLLARRGLRGAVRFGAWFTLGSGISMAALSLAGVHAVWAIVLPQWMYMIGHGIHQPCGQAGAVGPFPARAGTAASLSGFCMMVVAFLVGLFLGRTMNGTVYPMTLGIGVFAVLIATTAWTLVQRHGDPVAEHLAAAASPA
jgi:DHA1 family bicyclomycin/chloramphenicol resistance-like MFS transporter